MFSILANSIFFDKRNIYQLGLLGRIEEVAFSIHFLEKETYNKIMIGSKYEKVIKNLENAYFFIPIVQINTVILDLNYKAIPKIIECGQKNNCINSFFIYIKWGANIDKIIKI